jgi:3-methylcrotonyl-CoA carboxylase beta subunit
VTTRLRQLSDVVREVEARIREGGGAERIAKEHARGKLTARERIAGLCDPDAPFLELGLLVAYDQYDSVWCTGGRS